MKAEQDDRLFLTGHTQLLLEPSNSIDEVVEAVAAQYFRIQGIPDVYQAVTMLVRARRYELSSLLENLEGFYLEGTRWNDQRCANSGTRFHCGAWPVYQAKTRELKCSQEQLESEKAKLYDLELDERNPIDMIREQLHVVGETEENYERSRLDLESYTAFFYDQENKYQAQRREADLQYQHYGLFIHSEIKSLEQEIATVRTDIYYVENCLLDIEEIFRRHRHQLCTREDELVASITEKEARLFQSSKELQSLNEDTKCAAKKAKEAEARFHEIDHIEVRSKN